MRAFARVEQIFGDYEQLRRGGTTLQNGELHSLLKLVTADSAVTLRSLIESGKQRATGGIKRMVQPRSINQRRYVEAIEQADMVFGIGPAGTGKTYLAVAMAASALLAKKVNRIILVRPAVEAGERLGFLPGTLQEKIDPYLRPLYDALYDLLEQERVDKMIERNVIEVAPLAFMRGRTLNDAVIIMDEAQNTTSEQMKMFLTRLGNNAKAIITGDITQIDLPNPRRFRSGRSDRGAEGGRWYPLLPLRGWRCGATPSGAAHYPGVRRLWAGAGRAAAAASGWRISQAGGPSRSKGPRSDRYNH